MLSGHVLHIEALTTMPGSQCRLAHLYPKPNTKHWQLLTPYTGTTQQFTMLGQHFGSSCSHHLKKFSVKGYQI